MDWTAILANAGIPESPGRQEAVLLAKQVTRLRLEAKHRPAPDRQQHTTTSRPKRRRK